MSEKPLSPEAIEKILKAVPREGKVFLVGGQALNAWAGRYDHTPGLDKFAPFASKDIDFHGSAKVAEKVREKLGGEIDIPSMDDCSPETARIRTKIGGENVSIDFMGSLAGVDPEVAAKRSVPFEIPQEGKGPILFDICHPIDTFRSRVANVIVLGRNNDHAIRQLGASVLLVSAYIDHMLETGLHKGATKALSEIYEFLRSEIAARDIELHSPIDPIEILRRFAEDQRLDERYRQKTLAPMIAQLAERRDRRQARRPKAAGTHLSPVRILSERLRVQDPDTLSPEARLHYECMIAFEAELDEVNEQIDERGVDAPDSLIERQAKLEGLIAAERSSLDKLL